MVASYYIPPKAPKHITVRVKKGGKFKGEQKIVVDASDFETALSDSKKAVSESKVAVSESETVVSEPETAVLVSAWTRKRKGTKMPV